MIPTAVQSLADLVLAGVLCYVIFSHAAIRRRPKLQQSLIGLALGGLVILLGVEAHLHGDLQIPLEADLGPLLFAGYLGGPIGGAIAATMGSLFRITLESSMPVVLVEIFTNIALVALGILLRFVMPTPNWPRIPARVIWPMLAGFIVLQFLPPYMVGLFTVSNQSADTILFDNSVVVAVGIASILLTWQVLNMTHHLAQRSTAFAQMADRLKLALHASGMGYAERAAGQSSVHLDARMLEINGLTDREPGEVPLEELWALTHPDDVAPLDQTMAQAAHIHDTPMHFDIRIYRKSDGDLRYLRVHWINSEDPETGASRTISTIQDLTDLRRAEADREEALERLRIASEGFPGVIYQGLWAEDRVVRHLYISSKCEKYWGITAQQAYDNPDLLGGRRHAKEIKAAARMMLENAQGGVPIHIRTKELDGWIDFYGNATDLGDGTFRVDGVAVDVTAEVAAQDEAKHQADLAQRAQRMESIGRLTGGIAHDFNNLLAVIMGNLELLKDELNTPDHLRMIEAGLAATRRGADLTRSMLAFARRARLAPEPLDLNEIIRQSQIWMSRTLPATVEIETSLLAGLWQVRLDQTSLESAILNLLLNARDAMDGHGKLTLETANVRIDEAYIDSRDQELTPGRYAMLAISDTGTGIAPETLKHIFDPFYTTKAPGQGSGIGLSMVEGFVKQSGGTVQVYTEPGRGTTFKLYFPAQCTAPVSAVADSDCAATRAASGQRILLAEDEAAVRNVLCATLSAAGYRVTPAASGDQALAIFENTPDFDLLITDIVMPGSLQGTGLARALRLLAPELPMIFMSGYASEATVHGNGLRPEDTRLMKPVPKDDLLKAVARALAATMSGAS
ncbi:ATP-binding protein [Salipiger sp. 1_MG-2023]|uniref:ATP-binding protein n=1 Tax=Salipiger sp. 1_MG-2023 TaxID=3062665 RepID=UPI0026E27756|nr:ATP-binding protein [Salipiger sp. 1_MG-2023]MDO6585743.1 ATP-binding protein [Salipiger sp. 1_MG-2023]